MQTVKLKADSRDTSGKGAARRMRANGLVPAVFYGRGAETRSLAVSPKALVEALSGELGKNSVLELDVDGTAVKALLADYQLHPVTRAVLHADFKAVVEDRPVQVEVPLEFVGKAKGIVMGGRLRQVFLKVPVTCLPSQIPAKITHDVTELNVEDIVRVSDLALPEGITVRLRPAQTLGGVYGNRKSAADEEEATTATAAPADKKADKK